MIWLLRHAEAADGAPDEDRTLTEAGVQQARAAGAALRRLGVRLDVCLTSPKRRARQTAELACQGLGVTVSVEPRLAGEPFEIPALAAGLDDVLLVGHDPSFSMSLHDFTGAQVRLRKAGLAAVAKGELIVLLRPQDVAAIAEGAEVPA